MRYAPKQKVLYNKKHRKKYKKAVQSLCTSELLTPVKQPSAEDRREVININTRLTINLNKQVCKSARNVSGGKNMHVEIERTNQ